ncbi:hypothetical protein GCM10009682_00910 [Luedemannella flava]|uniref:Uncharacterized protein n=1 Tax=Luedemannella flava TaxID=349316 RepID=A0ABN2LBM7_9ACTN
MRTYRVQVAGLAAPGVAAARAVYLRPTSDVVRVAALVEISAAAAALARTVVKLRHLDPDLLAPHVADRCDLMAVLGRGRWLPTMVRHVPEPPPYQLNPPTVRIPSRSVRHRLARRADRPGQPSLFATTPGGR